MRWVFCWISYKVFLQQIFVQVERGISQALLDLEVNSDLKAQLRELHITAAKVREGVVGWWGWLSRICGFNQTSG